MGGDQVGDAINFLGGGLAIGGVNDTDGELAGRTGGDHVVSPVGG